MGLWIRKNNPNWVINRHWIITEPVDSRNRMYIVLLLESLGFTCYWSFLQREDTDFMGTNSDKKYICGQSRPYDDDIVVTTKQVIDALVKLKKSL